MDIQLLMPEVIPFSDYKIEFDNFFIKFLDGDNLTSGDIYCQCKLTDDVSWRETRTIKRCQNPQWYESITLPITNENNQVQVEIKDKYLISDNTFGSFTITINDISKETKKLITQLKKGTISYLIQRGNNGTIPFSDYVEPFEKRVADKVMLAIKLVEAKNL